MERRITRDDEYPHGTSTPTYCSRLQWNSRQISNREEATVAHCRTHPNATLYTSITLPLRRELSPQKSLSKEEIVAYQTNSNEPI